MKEKITPVGLKGYEINERMKELMGIKTINENVTRSAIELTKKGPDGNIYGIVRENHEYYIKISKKKGNNLVAEDFVYIGGLKNKKQEAYPTYAKAIKHLNLKFNSLNEAYGKSGQINVFETDGYGMNEYDTEAMDSFIAQYGPEKGREIYYATANKQNRNPETFEKNEDIDPLGHAYTDDMENQTSNDNAYTDAFDTFDPIAAAHAEYMSPSDRMYSSDDSVQAQQDAEGFNDEDIELSPEMQEVEDMMFEAKKPKKKGKLSIATALEGMDSIIESIVNPSKKKVYTLK